MPVKPDVVTASYDPADHIRDEEDVLAYIGAAFEDGDPEVVIRLVDAVNRSEGMAVYRARKNGEKTA